MLSANRLSRRPLPWLRPLLSAAAVVLLVSGCQSPPPETTNAGSPPPGSGGPVHPTPPAPAPPPPPLQAQADRPYGIMLDACEGFVCQDDNAKVTVTFYANKGSGHPRGLDYQLYSLPAFAKQPLGMHPSKPTNIGGDEYQFIIDTNTLATGHFPPAGDYAIVVHVNVAGAGKPDQYAAATLHVRHCTPDELEKFRQFHRFMSIAQDVPASAVPTPSDVLSVGQSGAQIEVNLTAGASQNDVMNIAFFRASDGTPIPVTGPGTSTSFTIVQGSTSGAYVILTGNGITGPLDTAQDVVAVATVASSGNSTSCSFTVQ